MVWDRFDLEYPTLQQGKRCTANTRAGRVGTIPLPNEVWRRSIDALPDGQQRRGQDLSIIVDIDSTGQEVQGGCLQDGGKLCLHAPEGWPKHLPGAMASRAQGAYPVPRRHSTE